MKKEEKAIGNRYSYYTVHRLYRRKKASNHLPSYKWVDEGRMFNTLEKAEKYINDTVSTSIDIVNYTPEDRFIIRKEENIKIITYDEE